MHCCFPPLFFSLCFLPVSGTWSSVQDWSPHMNFILKGSQISALQLKGCFKSKNIELKYKIHITLVCINYVVHVSTTMWRIKNRPSNSTSCSDNTNTLCLLVIVACKLNWGLQVTSSCWICGCVLDGCFERGIFWRAKSRLKGTEDFNLEHWLEVARVCLWCVKGEG